MAKILISLLLLVSAIVPGEATGAPAKQPSKLTAGEMRLMNSLARHLGGSLQKKDEARLRRLVKQGDGPAGAFAAALLFRHRPDRYRRTLFTSYRVRDYALRAQGRYNNIDRKELSETLRDIETSNAGLRDSRLVLLLAFLHYRDVNGWFYMKEQRISAARIFRTAFLNVVLKGSDIDPVDLANAIDHATRKAMGF